jgi:pyridoxal phosphate enzyme (YggS family)
LPDSGRDTTLGGFPGRIASVRGRIAAAARRCGRPPEEVRLLGASKTVPVEKLVEAVRDGLSDLGENRVQEARAKQESWPANAPAPTWHLIGPLQSNKVKWAVQFFDWVHTVDSASLGRELSRRAGEAGRHLTVLVEVNTTGEAAKHGVPPEAAESLVAELIRLPHLDVRGLMTMGPLGAGEAETRSAFRRLRELREELRQTLQAALPELSMGMSGDFEWAVEEGATWVRVGTVLFGARA